MLKRLELIGFKSFADKTVFDFHEGITAVVGPNGSGKSNIVDAVRWILGEQSAKSLRGGEMADVIFNGSASRRGFGMAEVTMTFDNRRKVLNSEADEVQVTRRVYRDGTGEYLLNGQASRLKDLKELFLGSGAGAGSYCIIEQGRVDALLQANTKDRRLIFEEAAGISRFKAKKTETLRKLDNTTQNLDRVKDILGEVDKQLRKVRTEAAKARKYKEINGQLRELRLGVGVREDRRLSEAVRTARVALEELRTSLSDTTHKLEEDEAAAARLAADYAAADKEYQAAHQSAALASQAIETRKNDFTRSLRRLEDFEEASLVSQTKWLAARLRIDALKGEQATLADSLTKAEAELAGLHARIASMREERDASESASRSLQRQLNADQLEQVEQVREITYLEGQKNRHDAERQRLTAARDRHKRMQEQHIVERDSYDRSLESLKLNDGQLKIRIQGVKDALDVRTKERDELAGYAEMVRNELGDLRLNRERLGERRQLLENLEQTQEGLGGGAKEVMSRIRDGAPGLVGNVVGLVADLLDVPGDIAPLVDLALGDSAQRFVVRDPVALDAYLSDTANRFTGRVGFLPLRTGADRPGDMRSADRLVTCVHADLPKQLLGSTLIVEDLSTARFWSKASAELGFRYVTRAGEVLEVDGSLTVGTASAAGGIVSRKSELRELRQQLNRLQVEIAAAEERYATAKRGIDDAEAPIHGLEHELNTLRIQTGDLDARIAHNRERRDQLHELALLAASDLDISDRELKTLEEAAAACRQQGVDLERRSKATAARVREAEAEQKRLDAELPALRKLVGESEQDIARREVQLISARKHLQSLEGALQMEGGQLRQAEVEAVTARTRCREELAAALEASADRAILESDREQAQAARHDADARRALLNESKKTVEAGLNALRSANRDSLQKLHDDELQLRDREAERTLLADRLREDYQVEVDALAVEPEWAAWLEKEDESPRWRAETADLKDRLRKLGGVNMEALEELEAVEARAKDIKAQYDDLTEAKKALLEIIDKINGDSRRMLAETLNAVREHFQGIFQQLFGGGNADIVMEDESDVLESGMEIVARPPGKELRSISLMSGGEKTMTAVALLLAIFRSRPSPFCLLDEVDAALDEANTTRLAAALKEFTRQSQFIIITHKKRMMSAADVLYGVTMQESGVSRQIAIRFEDWEEPVQESPRLAA